MKNRSAVFTSIVVALAVGAGFFGKSLLDRRHPVAEAAPGASPASDDQGVAQLRDEVQSLRRQVGAVAGNALRPEQPAAQPAEPSKPRTEAEIREAEYTHSQHIATYSNAYFEREHQDPAWAAEREHEITASLETLEVPGFGLQKTECRTTICRTILTRAPGAATQPLGPAVGNLEPFRKMGTFFHYEDDKVVMYSPREGHGYPSDPSLAQQ